MFIREETTMSKTMLHLTNLVAMVLLVAASAGASNYRVNLHNGNSFMSRYEPVDAGFDDSVLMFLGDRGNWIAIPKVEVESVDSLIQTQGRGTVIDAVTILIGLLSNDKPSAEESAEMAAEAANRPVNINYSMPLFSEPDATGGIPLSFTGMTTPPMGNSGSSSSFANQRRNGGGPVVGEPFARNF